MHRINFIEVANVIVCMHEVHICTNTIKVTKDNYAAIHWSLYHEINIRILKFKKRE